MCALCIQCWFITLKPTFDFDLMCDDGVPTSHLLLYTCPNPTTARCSSVTNWRGGGISFPPSHAIERIGDISKKQGFFVCFINPSYKSSLQWHGRSISSNSCTSLAACRESRGRVKVQIMKEMKKIGSWRFVRLINLKEGQTLEAAAVDFCHGVPSPWSTFRWQCFTAHARAAHRTFSQLQSK